MVGGRTYSMATASIAVRFEFGIEIGGPPNSVISGTKNVDPKSEERRTKMPTEAWGRAGVAPLGAHPVGNVPIANAAARLSLADWPASRPRPTPPSPRPSWNTRLKRRPATH